MKGLIVLVALLGLLPGFLLSGITATSDSVTDSSIADNRVTASISAGDSVMMSSPFVWTVGGIVLGFILKVLFDAWKSPELKTLTVSKKFEQVLGVTSHCYVNGHEPRGQSRHPIYDYNVYFIKIENKQKRVLNSAAESCMAWLELGSVGKAYQLSWLGGTSEVTINVGDTREVIICARETQKGKIFIPKITPKGDLGELSPQIGDGTSELQGKLRVSSKNGKKLETSIRIKPSANNELEIIT